MTDKEKAAREILKKHCPTMDDLFLDNNGRAYRQRVIDAMMEYCQGEIDKLRSALKEVTQWRDPRKTKPKKDVIVLIQYVDGVELGCYCGYGEWHCPNSYYSPEDKPIGWRPIDCPAAEELLKG